MAPAFRIALLECKNQDHVSEDVWPGWGCCKGLFLALTRLSCCSVSDVVYLIQPFLPSVGPASTPIGWASPLVGPLHSANKLSDSIRSSFRFLVLGPHTPAMDHVGLLLLTLRFLMTLSCELGPGLRTRLLGDWGWPFAASPVLLAGLSPQHLFVSLHPLSPLVHSSQGVITWGKK